MGRPRQHSDEALLDAALRVLHRVGAQHFTLAAAAAEIGVTRPALIQRFGPREDLVRAMAARQVALTRLWLGAFPVERGEAGLRRFLTGLVEALGTGEALGAHIALATLEAEDPGLAGLAAERYKLVRAAIAARVPRGLGLSPRSAAALLHAVIAGAAMQWAAEGGRSQASYVQLRVDQTLLLMIPPVKSVASRDLQDDAIS